MEEKRQIECEQYIQNILDTHKYFTFPMLRGPDYTTEELFITLKGMREKKKIACIRVPCKINNPDDSVMLYTTVEYSYLNEPREFLRSLGISISATTSYMTKLRTRANYTQAALIRTERKRATLKDIEYKNNILKYLNLNGPADIATIAQALDLEHTRAKALVSSLSVAKTIKYDPKTRKYSPVTSRY